MFAGRKILIATKHQKELVIAPAFEDALQAMCIVPEAFDTDQFGTFSGEIERKLSPLDTARLKCYAAMKATGYDLAVSSEGSFGPHPSLFFVPADDELLVLIDQRNEIEIVVRELSTETNFNSRQIRSKDELIEFAKLVQFPSHGIILKFEGNTIIPPIKGIQDWDLLMSTYDEHAQQCKSITAETDMRACCNPTRMDVIRKATLKLIEKIKSVCPNCNTPGFGITDHMDGLPCSQCGISTRSTFAYIRVCQKCGHKKEDFFPHGKKTEDPMYCDYCNP